MYLIDLDGVLVDWMTPAMTDMGLADRIPEITDHDMSAIGGFAYVEKNLKRTLEWWVNLPKLPWADLLMARAQARGDIRFLTSGVWEQWAPSGKWLWIQRHYPGAERKLFLGADKWMLSAHGTLIDDCEENVAKFTAKGGTALLFPAQWNSNRHIDPYEFIKAYV